MNKYESVIILKSTIDENMKEEKIKEYKNFLKKLTNTKVELEDLGKKRLAYEVKGNKEGVYEIFKFGGNPNHISDLEKKYRLDEDVIKFITIRQEELYEEDENSEEDEQEM